jgi:hypothetical protein
MNAPKLTPAQWFRLVLSLLPHIRTLVKATGMGTVAMIRTLVDLVARVESLFPLDPTDLGADGKPRRRGSEKAAAFAELVQAAFVTADEAIAATEAGASGTLAIASEVSQAGAVIVELFNQWRIFASGVTNERR